MADNDVIQAARDVVSAFNDSDWGKYQELFTSDCLYDEVGTSRRLEGLDAVVPALKGWKEAMPDVKGTVTNAVSTGNTVTRTFIPQTANFFCFNHFKKPLL